MSVKKPITWYRLFRRLRNQPVSATKNRAEIHIDGQKYEVALVFADNGSNFHLEVVNPVKPKKTNAPQYSLDKLSVHDEQIRRRTANECASLFADWYGNGYEKQPIYRLIKNH